MDWLNLMEKITKEHVKNQNVPVSQDDPSVTELAESVASDMLLISYSEDEIKIICHNPDDVYPVWYILDLNGRRVTVGEDDTITVNLLCPDYEG